jgi:hypothetical protein
VTAVAACLEYLLGRHGIAQSAFGILDNKPRHPVVAVVPQVEYRSVTAQPLVGVWSDEDVLVDNVCREGWIVLEQTEPEAVGIALAAEPGHERLDVALDAFAAKLRR